MLTLTVVCVNPPMTVVSPSATSTSLSTFCVGNTAPTSFDWNCTSEFSTCTFIWIWRFARDLRRHREDHAGLLHLHRGAREVAGLVAAGDPASMTRIGTCVPAVRFAVRLFNTARARLGLHVEQRVRLQRLEERREVVVAHRRRVDELQRGARNARRRVGDRRDGVAAEQNLAGVRARLAGRVEARHDVVEELLTACRGRSEDRGPRASCGRRE